MPNVTIREARGAAVITPDVDFAICIVGATTASPLPALTVSALYSDPATFAADYGLGDAVDCGTTALTQTDGNPQPPAIAIYPTPATTLGARGATLDTSGITGTAVVTKTAGTHPVGTYQPVGRVADDGNNGNGGLIGSAGIVLEFSPDNGDHYLPTQALGTSFTIKMQIGGVDTGVQYDLAPSTTNAAYVTIAVELRLDTLAHLANVVAHDGADTSAAQVALAASSVPATVTASTAVVNLVLTALVSHVVNITAVHEGPDLVARNALALLSAATNAQTGIALAIALKGILNTHDAAALAASATALMGTTASIVAPTTYTAASDMLAGGVALMDAQPRRPTVTTGAGGTPADMPATVALSGFDYAGAAQNETLALSQTAGTATAAKAYKGTGFQAAFAAADGTGASFTMGIDKGVHESADATNTITSPDPTYGTLFTGDTWSESKTTPPQWAATDLYNATDPDNVIGALPVIMRSTQEFGIIVITEPIAESDVDVLTAALNYVKQKRGKRWRILARFRDPGDSETDPQYILAWRTFVAATEGEDRLTTCVGSGTMLEPLRALTYQRSGLPAVVARCQGNAIIAGKRGEKLAQHLGYVGRGPLEGFEIADTDHDEQIRGGIASVGNRGGGLCFYRAPNADVPGTYVFRAPTLYPAGSEVITYMDRALVNGVERVLAAVLWQDINGAEVVEEGTNILDEGIRDAIGAKGGTAIRARYASEFQNADDIGLVVIDATTTVVEETVIITGTARVRPYLYAGDIIITLDAGR